LFILPAFISAGSSRVQVLMTWAPRRPPTIVTDRPGKWSPAPGAPAELRSVAGRYPLL